MLVQSLRRQPPRRPLTWPDWFWPPVGGQIWCLLLESMGGAARLRRHTVDVHAFLHACAALGGFRSPFTSRGFPTHGMNELARGIDMCISCHASTCNACMNAELWGNVAPHFCSSRNHVMVAHVHAPTSPPFSADPPFPPWDFSCLSVFGYLIPPY